MNVHYLNGCAPAPLAHYLKALGVLRVVAEQLDPLARGWWEGERFVLATCKREDELLAFFLESYAPTPVVAPWNKGSGFYANDRVLLPAESSTAPRFESLRRGIQAARAALGRISAADQRVREIKAETKSRSLGKVQRDALRRSPEYKKRLAEAERDFKELKADLIPGLRLAWRGRHREWMDAAVVLDGEGTARFPALLGTGGNDGRLDFTNNYFQRLAEIFDFADPQGRPLDASQSAIQEALFGEPGQVMLSGVAVGQFLPGGAGGANATQGPDGGSRMNPFDFVLMLEGAILFAAAVSRRWDQNQSARASASFAVAAHSAAYASAASSEDSARGEQWMPLWKGPTTLSDLGRLLADGRAQVGSHSAREPLDLARAVARLGTARGVHAFQRFGYIERNGQSNLAVPLGRFVVPDKASPGLACLDDLDAWLPRLRRQSRAQQAPARLVQVERRLADAVFGITQHPGEPQRWQTLLLRLADVEAVQVNGSGYQAGPIPRLRPEWVEAADDDSAELRLALALAMQAGDFSRTGVPLRDSGVRRHWVSLEKGRYVTTGTGGQQRLQSATDRVMGGRNGIDDAIALVVRRSIEAAREGSRRLSLVAGRSTSSASSDLALLIGGAVNVDRTVALARALMAIDARRWALRPAPPRNAPRGEVPDDAWLAIRLAHLPWPLPDGRCVGYDPAIVRRLEAGDAAEAVNISLRRLRAAGIRPALHIAAVPQASARLWAAGLAFPICQKTAAVFLARLDPNSLKETAP